MNGQCEYDVVIIGAGPGGYVAGIRAAQLGLKSCVIERDKPGGVCLNVGCIPTKSLIHQATIFSGRSALEDMGVTLDTSGFDFRQVMKKANLAAARLSQGVEYLLKKNGVPLISSTASLVSPNEVSLDDGTLITGKNILIATGSRPKEIPGFTIDEKDIISSSGVLTLDQLPGKILIIGAGAIGCEFAYIMSSFGVEVTLLEALDSILPLEDRDGVAVLNRSFRSRGIKTITGARAASLSKHDDIITVTLENVHGDTKTVTVDKILAAIGRTPNTEFIGLDRIGLEPEDGFIPVGDYYQTMVPGVYAVGDVASAPLLAHAASREGEIAVEHMAGIDTAQRVDRSSIPSVVYTEPQIASFGMTAAEAQADRSRYRTVSFPYRGAGKAVAIGKIDGIVKVTVDIETKMLAGAHIAGAGASELIHELLLVKTAGLTPDAVLATVHAHPTLSELVLEVMRAVEGRPLHM